MAYTLTVANQKGGVGKTTTVINLGAALAERGHRILLVDMDPQGGLSTSMGVESYFLDKTIYQVLTDGRTKLQDVIIQVREKIFVAPANIDLSAAEMELVSAIAREYILRDSLKAILPNYDFILIDTPPSLGLLTINALVAAKGVIIPLQCEYLAFRALRILLETIKKVKARLNRGLRIIGILPTMYDSRLTHSKEVLDEIRSIFGPLVFNTVVKKSVKFAEAPVAKMPILEYAPQHDGAEAYRKLAEEVLNVIQSKPQGQGG